MTGLLRHRISELYSNYEKRDLNQVMTAFDDAVRFTSYAPIDIFPFLGHKVGKPALTAALVAIGEHYDLLGYKPTFIVTEGDKAAALITAQFRQRTTGRTIQVTLAHFITFRDGLIVEFREFMDTFDAVEQVLGHEIVLKQPA